MAATDEGFRVWLGLELSEEWCRDLGQWLQGAFEPVDGAVTLTDETDMFLRAGVLVGRRRELLGPVIRDLPNIDPGPIRVRLAASLRALPSRQRPQIYLLPARCHGLAAVLRRLSVRMPEGSIPIRPGRVHPHLLVGRAGTVEQSPRHRPSPLPRRLRGPVHAVRLGLYCSQTTPENDPPNPLAQVELPVAAAVR